MIFSLALLLPLAFSALFSEYAGKLAVFLESLVNLSSFLFFLLVINTGNLAFSAIITMLCVTIFMILVSVATEKLRLNPFVAGLGINLSFSALVSFVANKLFATKGLLTEAITKTQYLENTNSVQVFFICAVFVLIVLFFVFLRYTKAGLALQVSGLRPDFLFFRGFDYTKLYHLAWALVGFLSCFSGILCTLKFQGYVPNVCSGRGWVALALVFIGKKKPLGVLLATVFYSLLEFVINNNSTVFGGLIKNVNPTLLLSLPYFVILLALFFMRTDKAESF